MVASACVFGQKDQALLNRIIEFERAMGVSCGGMDQTISLLGKEGKALYIEFDPIVTEDIDLPDNIEFVIANSLTESPKLNTLGTRYNKRVCECKLAIELLCSKLGIDSK